MNSAAMLVRTVLLLLVFCSFAAQAQMIQPPLEGLERTQWFREAKFGMFIHWGPYAVIGRHEWARHRFQIPQAEYGRYARAFNPVPTPPPPTGWTARGFDDSAWVRARGFFQGGRLAKVTASVLGQFDEAKKGATQQ